MTTYTKLKSGNWGVRSTSPLSAGQTVTVTKKSGEAKRETIERVVWSGNGVWIAAVANRSHRRAPYGKIECDECGEYVTRGSVCWETGFHH